MDYFAIGISLALFAIGCWLFPVVKGRFSIIVRLVVVILSLLLAFFCGMYLVSDMFTNNGINEAVLYHLDVGLEGAGFSDFINIIVFSVGLLLLTFLYSFVCCKVLFKAPKAIPLALAGVLFLPAAFAVNPGVDDLVGIGYLYFSDSQSSELPGFYKESKISELKINVIKPKNLVLIYGESLERTYFNESVFPNLMPELSELENESLSFTNIVQLPGTGWTIGGMVASQCGIPLVVSSGGNSMEGVDSFIPGAYCLGDVLSEQGYTLGFMGGADASFAGKGDFYKTHDFDSVNGLKELGSLTSDPDYRNAWGLHDDTTFSFVKKRFDELADGENPFALVTLTLGTHHPEGFLSRGCESTPYGSGDEPMLNAVYCSDKIIADLVDYIMNSEHAKDTLVVVMSDHLAMNNTVSDKLQSVERRDLFMVHGADVEPAHVDRQGSTLDVAPTILNMMGFKADALGLGRDLLDDSQNFVEKYPNSSNKIRDLFPSIRNLWMFPSLENGIELNVRKQSIQIGEREFSLPLLLKLDHQHEIDDMLMSQGLYKNLDLIEQDSPFIWFDECQKLSFLSQVAGSGDVCVLFAEGSYDIGEVEVYKGDEQAKFSTKDLKSHFERASTPTKEPVTIAEKFAGSTAGGVIYIDGKFSSAENYRPVSSAMKRPVTLKAIPSSGSKFVKWQGLTGPRQYSDTVLLTPDNLLKLEAATVTLAPVFDNGVEADNSRPVFRSAWAGIASKETGVIGQFLSPGNTVNSVARLAKPLKSGMQVDIRSVGGVAPPHQEHFVRVDGESVEKPGRGMKLVIVNASGEILSSKVYDTFSSKEESRELEQAIESADKDSTLVFATQDEFTQSMTPGLIKALKSLGFNLAI